MARQTRPDSLIAACIALALLLAAPRPAHAQDSAGGSHAIVSRLYAAPGTLLWHADGRLGQAAHSAIRLLGAAAEHGLDPADYDAGLLDSLVRRRHDPAAPEDRARLDRLLTAAVARYLDHLQGGRASRRPEGAAAALRSAIAADSIAGLAAALAPRLVQYRWLQAALAEYRGLARDTSLGGIPSGRLVRPGERFAEAGRLGRLLAALGDLPPDTSGPPRPVYEGALVEAVLRFQERHGLEPDGVIGPATFGALEVPLAWRQRQLELALERLRRLPPFEGPRLLVVNVPAFRIFGFDSAEAVGRPAFSSRAVVGRSLDARTPVISGRLSRVDFRPYWNVPRSILLNEILPLLHEHPEYLRENRMELVDRDSVVLGDEVSPAALEGLRLGTLRVRQRPGPGNALGPVKLVFPNPEGIYIHGTPHPALFALARRDLSHGCIRVEKVDGLTAWVLRDQRDWTGDSTAAALNGARSRSVDLTRPIAVAVFYTTAAVDGGGRVRFYEDLYGLDQALDHELRQR